MDSYDHDEEDHEELAEDWWDDEPICVKEEPDYEACDDASCRSREPTRWDLWRSSIRWWLRRLRGHAERWATFSDEPPF